MLKTIIKKCNINYLFVFSYSILLLADIMYRQPIIEKYNKWFVLTAYIGMCIFVLYKIIKEKLYRVKDIFKEKKYIVFGMVALITLICYYFTKDATFIRLVLLVSCIYFIDFDYFVKADVSIKVALIVSTIILCGFGIIPDQISYRADKYVRHSMGFKNPNLLSLYLTVIIFEVMYLLKNKKIILFPVGVLALVIFEYIVLNTKTTALIIPIGLLFYIVYSKKNNIIKRCFENKGIKILVYCLPMILSISAVLSIFIFKINPDLINFLNKITSGRIEYWTQFFNEYGFSILGKNVPDILHIRYVLDNTYLKLLIKFGIIQFIIFIIVLFLNTKKGYVYKKYDLLFFIVMLEIYGAMESIVMIPGINIFMLYFAANEYKNRLM